MPSDVPSKCRRRSRRLDQDKPTERHLQFRIGVHVGDVMVRDGDLLGDGVNIAARLESLAEPGTVYISAETHAYAAPGAYPRLR